MKLSNRYVREFDPVLYRDTPKAVWAAVALMVPHNGGSGFVGETPEEYVIREWHIQHRQGLIPQPVPGRWRHLLTEAERERTARKGEDR